MIYALTTLLALAAPSPTVAVVPLDQTTSRDVAVRAMFHAIDGALPEAAAARGLGHRRFALVVPVDEAARACRDDACRRTQAKRLGARYAIVVKVVNAASTVNGELTLTLLDGEAELDHHVTVRGLPPFLLAQAPAAVAALLEQVAPRVVFQRAEALTRLRKARSDGDQASAARICFELAVLLPNEMAVWTFDGADLLAESGQLAEAAAIFSQLALDESIDEEMRVEALARSRVPQGS